MEIEVVQLHPDGSGYAVVHLADGSSFGQQFTGADLSSSESVLAHIQNKVQESIDRQAAEAVALAATKALPRKQGKPDLPTSLKLLVGQRIQRG